MTVYHIVGINYAPDKGELLRSLPDGEPLTLSREPTNRFDPSAVQIIARGQRVGYVPRGQAARLARVLDACAHDITGRLVQEPLPKVKVDDSLQGGAALAPAATLRRANDVDVG